MWKLQSLAILLIGVVVYWMVDNSIRSGRFRVVYNHSTGDCFRLSGIEHGSEDIEVLPSGLAFISSGLSFLGKKYNAGVGQMYLFDFNHPKMAPQVLKIVADDKYKTINPHGISLWTDPKTGDVYLYVINHTPDTEAVDKFKFSANKKTLQHIKRFDHQENFHVINDLVVVDEDQFYYTNYIYGYFNLEMILRLRWGSIGFYDGKNATIVESAGSLFIPNGITKSKDGKFLYLAHIGDQEVRVYIRNGDNTLKLHESVYVGTSADNLDVDFETGDIWIGAHPVRYKVFPYIDEPSVNLSPAQVLRIQLSSGNSPPTIEEVYSNEGNEISGSTVAVRYKQAFLIGSVRSHALYCKID